MQQRLQPLFCPSMPGAGLPGEVEGAQLQRKLENDVHCDYERASWSALYHRALGLNPAILHRLQSEWLHTACLQLPHGWLGWCAWCASCCPPNHLRASAQMATPCPAAPARFVVCADVKDFFPDLPAQLHLDPAFPLPLRLNHFQSKTCERAGVPGCAKALCFEV